MPIYGYRCESCGGEIEVMQAMHAAAPDRCSHCDGQMARVPSRTSVNTGKYASRSAERHSKLSVEQQARKEGDFLAEHSRKTGVPMKELFEVHD